MIFKLLKFKLAIGRKMSRADLLIDWLTESSVSWFKQAANPKIKYFGVIFDKPPQGLFLGVEEVEEQQLLPGDGLTF